MCFLIVSQAPGRHRGTRLYPSKSRLSRRFPGQFASAGLAGSSHRVSAADWKGLGSRRQAAWTSLWKIVESAGTEPHGQPARCSLHRQDPKIQLIRKPLAEIHHDDSLSWKNLQQRALERPQTELDGCSRHRDAAQRAQLAHPKTEVAITQSNFGQFQADSGSNALPGHRRLGCQRIALSSKGNITDPVTARQYFVEMPFDPDEIKRQVEPVPTGQRGWQQRVNHATKYRRARSEFGIRNSE